MAYRYKNEVLENPKRGSAKGRRSLYRMDYIHVGLPASKVLEYRKRCQQILSESDIIVREWSIWARPEFFSFLIVEETPSGEDDSSSMKKAVDQVLSLAQDIGGSMEYCHGVGTKLAHLMERELGLGMEVLRQIKRALDPNNILHPGNMGV